MNAPAFFHGRRDRRLAALLAVALVSVGGALGGLYYREAVLAPRYQPMDLFPGLKHKLVNRETTHIYIVSKKFGAFEVAFVPTKGWVLPGKGNYPVALDTLNQTLAAFAEMKTVEPKTDRPDLFHFVDLDPPPQGDGVLVTLAADKGYRLASMIVGKAAPMGDEVGLFVRRAGENQSFLVTSPATIKADPAAWMDKSVVNLDMGNVASVEVKPATGPAYTASRTASAAPFTIAPLPKGRELVFAGAADATAAALSDFGFDDIARSTDFNFNDGPRLVLHSFDGLEVTVNLVSRDGATWARIAAMAAPGNQKAAKEALTINAHTVGWAFKLPAYKATAFAPTLESLLKPKN